MPGLDEAGDYTRKVRFRRTAFISLLAATALFLVSFTLQLLASLQRWVTFSGTRGPTDTSVEDHVYDYFIPGDDWEPIGTAAQLLGAGLLVQVLGLLAMALGIMLLPATTRIFSRLGTAGIAVLEAVLVLLVAATFTAHGGYLLASGANGTIPGMQIGPGVFWTMFWAALLGLGALALIWGNRLPAAGAACALLIGTTLLGYLLATYVVAPIFFGGSHDTARFTETVVAASTAAAAIALAFGARDVVRRADVGVERA
ncbi:hypothetical protein GCM10009715_25530 [Paeniglutamicibacter psychrophenolicus]|uniref:Uncharacterized protein n=1 Tax=Paeniglutamicibacter psychrophenolicus TaxID=257454 RepID=A0ABS4WE84_9MICC|nr:hypothetical protein [Paeniglutamicibacter psychrophenolicus]MBP2374506.1 hypothetical protein [Paeniglutamicibacter psychrophenolicus]